MRSTVVAAEMATAAGIPTAICNGLSAEALTATLDGDPPGTLFPARAQGYSSFKLWLKYAKPTHGTIVVDDGAVRALREGGRSLLPVGIVEVRGAFDAGDAVEVVGLSSIGGGGAYVGKGISNYAADDLRTVAGEQSARVRELLPHASEEAVHCDYFVLD
jgi:glutamate 5-kinase